MDFTKDSIEPEAEEAQDVGNESVVIEKDTLTDGSVCSSTSQQIPESALSPWEKWVIKKAQEEREKRERECQLKLKEKEAAKTQRKVHREKQKKSEKAYTEWLSDKAQRCVASVQRERNAHTKRVQEVEKKKQLIEEKARASYKEWCVRKQRERMELEKRQLEEQQRKALLEQEKRARGAKAYSDWMRVNHCRPVETDWYGRMEERRTF